MGKKHMESVGFRINRSIRSNLVAGLRLTFDEISGNGSSTGRAGHLDDTDFLLFAIYEESPVQLWHGVKWKIKDHKSQSCMNG
jgi:hypothetical protein